MPQCQQQQNSANRFQRDGISSSCVGVMRPSWKQLGMSVC